MSFDPHDVPRITRGKGSPADPVRTLGVIGDIHAEDERLETAIGYLSARGVDRIVHVGDVVDGRGSLDRTLAILEAHAILGVAGNHERWFRARAMRELRNAHPPEALTDAVDRTLAGWPPLLEIATVAGTLLLCHAVPDDDLFFLRPDTPVEVMVAVPGLRTLMASARFSFVVAGHTHEATVHPVGSSMWINAGTLKWDDAPVVTLVDFVQREVAFHSLEDPRAIGLVRRSAL